MVMANQPNIVVADMLQTESVMIDVAIPDNCNIKKNENKKLEATPRDDKRK